MGSLHSLCMGGVSKRKSVSSMGNPRGFFHHLMCTTEMYGTVHNTESYFFVSCEVIVCIFRCDIVYKGMTPHNFLLVSLCTYKVSVCAMCQSSVLAADLRGEVVKAIMHLHLDACDVIKYR